MMRFLLSILALVSGLAVPGLAGAQPVWCDTEIGAMVEPGEPEAAVAAHAAVLSRDSGLPRGDVAQPAIVPIAARAAPLAPSVRIGSDRARE